jgi:hypothetical protein
MGKEGLLGSKGTISTSLGCEEALGFVFQQHVCIDQKSSNSFLVDFVQ